VPIVLKCDVLEHVEEDNLSIRVYVENRSVGCSGGVLCTGVLIYVQCRYDEVYRMLINSRQPNVAISNCNDSCS